MYSRNASQWRFLGWSVLTSKSSILFLKENFVVRKIFCRRWLWCLNLQVIWSLRFNHWYRLTQVTQIVLSIVFQALWQILLCIKFLQEEYECYNLTLYSSFFLEKKIKNMIYLFMNGNCKGRFWLWAPESDAQTILYGFPLSLQLFCFPVCWLYLEVNFSFPVDFSSDFN